MTLRCRGKFEEPTLEVVAILTQPISATRPVTTPVYSRVVINVPVVRPRGPYATKLFLPMLLLCSTAAPRSVGASPLCRGRIGIGITACLRWWRCRSRPLDLPEVDYLLLLDKRTSFSYSFVVLPLR